jgi:hypothetical protein
MRSSTWPAEFKTRAVAQPWQQSVALSAWETATIPRLLLWLCATWYPLPCVDLGLLHADCTLGRLATVSRAEAGGFSLGGMTGNV